MSHFDSVVALSLICRETAEGCGGDLAAVERRFGDPQIAGSPKPQNVAPVAIERHRRNRLIPTQLQQGALGRDLMGPPSGGDFQISTPGPGFQKLGVKPGLGPNPGASCERVDPRAPIRHQSPAPCRSLG